MNIGKNNNSLFFFLPFTPTRPRNTNTRVYACVRGGRVRIVETCDGSFPAKSDRRGPREQSPLAAEFVLCVRTYSTRIVYTGIQ